MENIKTVEWITVAAIILGPILAVQAQKVLEAIGNRKARRLNIFHTLMATRANKVSHSHVQALNMIDIEFYGRRVFGQQVQTGSEKSVTNAWKNYSDHLNNSYAQDQLGRWMEDGEKLLAKLLFEMSSALGYGFDEVQLRRNVYSPIAHGKQQFQEQNIREGIEQLLTGKKALPVQFHHLDEPNINAGLDHSPTHTDAPGERVAPQDQQDAEKA